MQSEWRIISLLIIIVFSFSGLVWLKVDTFNISPVNLWLMYGEVALTSWVLALPLILIAKIYQDSRNSRARPLVIIFDFVKFQLHPQIWLPRLLVILILALLLGSFTTFKSAIPQIRPFQYDALFMSLDRALFFGHDPWRITHALFGDAMSTWVLQQFYIYWFALMWISLAFVTLRADLNQLRDQYIMAFSLSFIFIGCLGALLFSSAGPCYYSWAAPAPNVYEPLMERLYYLDQELRSMSPPRSLNGLVLQQYLNDAHNDGSLVFGGGISAMPSMHVAVATLVALAAWTYQRWLGGLLAPVILIIWIGSIHLGWHYAVDGLVAFFLVLIIWWYSGRIVRAG